MPPQRLPPRAGARHDRRGIPRRRARLALAGALVLALSAGARAQPLEQRLGEEWRWRELRSPHPWGTHDDLAVDGRGRVLSQTDDRLHVYEDGVWRALDIAWGDEIPARLAGLPDGWLALLDTRRVVRIDASGRVDDAGLPPAHGTETLHALDDGSVFVMTDDALVEYGGRQRRLPLDAASDQSVLGVSGDGRVVFLHLSRALIEDGDGWAPLAMPFPLADESHYADVATSAGTAWFLPARLSARVPAFGLRDGAFRLLDAPLLTHSALAMDDGSVVVAAGGGGLRVVREGDVLDVAWVPGLDEQLGQLHAGPGGRLLAHTVSGRLWACDVRSERWTIHATPHGGAPATVSALAFDHDERLWVGSDDGVFLGSSAGLEERLVEAAGVLLRNVTALCVDAQGDVWIGSGGAFDGAVRYDGRDWHRVLDELGPYAVHAIEEGPDGSLWFMLLGHHGARGGEGGIVRFDGETWTRYTMADGLPSDRCYDVHFARDGALYAGTFDGVARWDGARWQPVPGLQGIMARTLVDTPDGALWVGSGVTVPGVYRVFGPPLELPSALERMRVGSFLADGADDELWMAAVDGLVLVRGSVLLDVTHELLRPERNLWPMARGPHGDLWIGSLGSGVLRYRPDDHTPPRIEQLAHGFDEETRRYLVHWRGIDPWETTAENALHHRWRLDGEDWSAVGRDPTITLPRLSAGEHRLEIEVYDLGGNVARLDKPLEILVPPPLLRRPQVLVPVGAIVAALAWIAAAGWRQRRAGRRAEASERVRILESERQHRGLVERANVLFARVDRAGAITYLGPGFTRYTAREGRAPRTIADLLAAVDEDAPREIGSSADAPIAAARFAVAFADGRAHRGELPFRARDGSRAWLLVTLTPHEGEGGACVGFDIVAVDVTDRKNVERDRLQLQERLRQAQKLEAVGQLAAGVAHDVNNVLTSIVGNAELLRLAIDARDADGRGRVDEILDATARAKLVTHQLLAFSRRQVLAPKVIDLNAMLSGMQPMLARLIPEDIRVDVALGDGIAPVRYDEAQIQQVVLNLVINARDAMPDGGTLTLATRATPRADAALPDGAARDRERVPTLVVTDTGEGMDAEVQQRIFEPFFTTKEVGKGTGLGLATVYGIVQQSGGGIRVNSAVGRGTTFEVFFVPADERARVVPAGARHPGGRRRAGTLLLCEDDPAVLDVTHRILEPHADTILAAMTPARALELARAHDGPIDVLVTDVVMPGMNGRELADALRADRPGTPVLFVSGYSRDAISKDGVVAGEVEFLQKPFRAEELVARVLELAAARDPGGPLARPLTSGSSERP